MRYFIQFSYDGRNYHGWQMQPNASSVQAEINKGLSVLLRSEILTTGAGRTDTGVSAKMMWAHFDYEGYVDDTDLVYKLNRFLPQDIAIQRIIPVASDAHARFDATSRTYHYFIYQTKNPFKRDFAARIAYKLDFEKMNNAAAFLLNVTDFTSFSKVNTDTQTNNCIVRKAVWERVDADLWRFEITANRFLRNMVRAIVGTLLEVGRGRMTLAQFEEVIACKDRCAAAESVPGNALFLVDIQYPYI